jgi:uncharacterized protein YndB with AHSA1/START domain
MADTTTMPAPIRRLADDTIQLERLLDASPDVVWDYLTKAELRKTWFMGGEDTPASGEFEVLVDHDNLSDDDVPYPDDYAASKGARMTEKVLRFDPPRLLETTFASGRNGTVTYELVPEGAGTRLIVTHRGIVSPTGVQDFGGGWNSHMIVLQEKLGGRSVRDFWALHRTSRAAVAETLGL